MTRYTFFHVEQVEQKHWTVNEYKYDKHCIHLFHVKQVEQNNIEQWMNTNRV